MNGSPPRLRATGLPPTWFRLDRLGPVLASFNATTGWTLARVDEQTLLPQLQLLLSFNHFSFIVCFSLWILTPFLLLFFFLSRFSNVERLATQKYPPIDRPRASEQDPFSHWHLSSSKQACEFSTFLYFIPWNYHFYFFHLLHFLFFHQSMALEFRAGRSDGVCLHIRVARFSLTKSCTDMVRIVDGNN